jgi:hypothetical protein
MPAGISVLLPKRKINFREDAEALTNSFPTIGLPEGIIPGDLLGKKYKKQDIIIIFSEWYRYCSFLKGKDTQYIVERTYKIGVFTQLIDFPAGPRAKKS